ncbi:MAG: hypothetical protein QW040_00875 [Candidatus Aenigmatarchaeota archaeon]
MGKIPIPFFSKISKERMRCLRCNSGRIFKFIDGFGERRIFCKDCFGSFLEKAVKKIEMQKNLHEFDLELYHKLGFHH